jgi:hypothetical protein
MNVYRPDKYTVSIGVPATIAEAIGIPLATPYIEIRDWVSITSAKSIVRFQYRQGVFGEPFVEMNRSTARVFSFSILQSSEDIRLLRELFRLQTFGEVGFPFSVFDDAIDSNSELLRQKSLYPVAVILDEPTESWALQGATWVYQMQLVAGETTYI